MSFKAFEENYLAESDVVSYLEELDNQGYDIRKGEKAKYYIMLSAEDYILIDKIGTTWYVKLYAKGRFKSQLKPIDKPTLINYSNSLAKRVKIDLNSQVTPNNIRLNQVDKATNKTKIIALSNGKTLESIFDPYFETKSIMTILSLWKLGLVLNKTVRVLKTTKTKIDQQFLGDFESETGIELKIKCCQSKKEHRRFMIFQNCEILILGMSLNDINKNEAAHLEISKEDCDFFEDQWKASKEC